MFTCNRYQGKEILVSGDGRCDSPGSSAKFCTYSLMEAESGTILHLETVDKREVNYKSPVMECEGLKRCLNHISTNTACTIKELTTDASSSIIALLRK